MTDCTRPVVPDVTANPERFPDDRVNNERFSGSAAAWIAIIVPACLIIAVLGLVLLSLK